MSRLLVRYRDNWADEMTVEGFEFFNQDDWPQIVAGISEGPFEVMVGSNQFIAYKNREDYLTHIRVTEITDEEYQTLDRLLGNGRGFLLRFGFFGLSSDNY